MVSPRPLDQIAKEDIDALVADGTSERRTIEYKVTLPGTTDADKKEFVADVSSLANAQGGDLVYGIDATDGVPTAAPGLANFNDDQTRLRFEALLRDGLDPRLHGVQMQSIAGFAHGDIFILRIPRSWSGPHRVKLKGTSRFYSRGSAGKFEMDTTDIRSAIERSGDLPKRIRDWRDERLGRILANSGPVELSDGGIIVLHLIPLESINDSWRFPMAAVHSKLQSLPPIDSSAWNYRLNIDGFLAFDANPQESKLSDAYTQLFRSGIIEAVNANLVYLNGSQRLVGSSWIEEKIVRAVTSYLKCMIELAVQPPVIFLLSLLRAKGAILHTRFTPRFDPRAIDRDVLFVPDVLIEDISASASDVLRPAFDAVWNAFGYERSYNYDEQGLWKPR